MGTRKGSYFSFYMSSSINLHLTSIALFALHLFELLTLLIFLIHPDDMPPNFYHHLSLSYEAISCSAICCHPFFSHCQTTVFWMYQLLYLILTIRTLCLITCGFSYPTLSRLVFNACTQHIISYISIDISSVLLILVQNLHYTLFFVLLWNSLSQNCLLTLKKTAIVLQPWLTFLLFFNLWNTSSKHVNFFISCSFFSSSTIVGLPFAFLTGSLSYISSLKYVHVCVLL